MNRFIGLALLAISSFAGAPHAQEIKLDMRVPGYTEADATVAIDLLRRNCRPLGKEFWEDVVEITATFDEETADHRRAHGWQNSLLLQVRYADEPKYGPSYASGTGVLAGHTLYFNLGGGDRPGFFVSKRSSQYLCGLPFNDQGVDLFVDVPGMKFLDR